MTKKKVAAMLRKYDRMRNDLRVLERELTKACVDYGRTQGIWGFTRDHLRMQIEREKAS